MKRKRVANISAAAAAASSKKTKLDRPSTAAKPSSRDRVYQTLLNHVYSRVRTLKEYLQQALPHSSRTRRRQLHSIEQEDSKLSTFLTTTLICGQSDQPSALKYDWRTDFDYFVQTQRAIRGHTASTQHGSMDEVIEFVISILFRNDATQFKKSNHILCQGFERSVTKSISDGEHRETHLTGIIKRRDNASVEALQSPVWKGIVDLLGRDGQPIIISLLLDQSVFISAEGGCGNYIQLSGVPVYDAMPEKKKLVTRPDSIVLARSRILYGKPSFGSAGKVRFGLRSSHILQRLTNIDPTKQSATLMRYLFPKQFGLHNMFTPEPDKKDKTNTKRLCKDYTYRETESAWDMQKKIPRRLREQPLRLTQTVIRRYNRCSVHQLIYHYCPIPMVRGENLDPISPISTLSASMLQQRDIGFRTQLDSDTTLTNSHDPTDDRQDNESGSLLPYATHPFQVASFCKAFLQCVLRRNTLGEGFDGQRNWKVLLENVDMLVCMRKFESISLHQLVQKLRLKFIQWLAPNNTKREANIALSDKKKREELLYELVYFIFDSLVIPIINANFYVTETGIHRNKLLFFRHDVWYRLCQPCLRSTILNGFAATNSRNINSATSRQKLGHSHLRLLPKDVGTRSIINLKRPTLDCAKGKRKSINEQLTSVFKIFNFERHGETGVFKSDSLSSHDLHTKLLKFKTAIGRRSEQRLYFVKVDIRSAFDSIPQTKLLDLVKLIFRHSQYSITGHNESRSFGPRTNLKTSSVFFQTAIPFESKQLLPGSNEGRITKRKNTVYSSSDRSYQITKDEAIKLLEEHVHNNTVKIDSKYYRQSSGIAQGSVLSSLLCTFFYNDFERSCLGFLSSTSSTLLRIIDDFLLITTNRDEAAQFVKAMAEGDASYGIRIHPEKSLANFDMTIRGAQISKTPSDTAFPFCGLLIDTKILQVSKHRVRKDNVVANTLTVDLHGKAGQKLRKRLEASMRIQLQGILLDSSLNDKMRIMRTLIECFQESTMKLYQYCKLLPHKRRPSQKTLIEFIQELIKFVVNVLGHNQGQTRMMLGQPQISALAATAMIRVLTPKQSQHGLVIQWLYKLKKQFGHSLNLGSRSLEILSDTCFESLWHYKY